MKYLPAGFLALLFFVSGNLSAQLNVNPDASPEAVALLDLFYSISGKYTLTSQLN